MQRKGRRFVRKASMSRTFAGIMMGFLVLVTGGCVLHAPLRLLSPNLSRARTRLYEFWHKENRAAYESYRELARANGWKMYVACGSEAGLFDCGIGRLESGTSEYTPVYTVRLGRRIMEVTPFCKGRTAFIEYSLKEPWWRDTLELRDFELGILWRDGAVTKVPLDAPEVDRLARIAMGHRYVFLTTFFFRKTWLYDVQTETLHAVSDFPSPGDMMETAGVLGDRYLLVLTGRGERANLVILEASEPYREVSRMQGVSNMVGVGEYLVVEKDSECFLHDPEAGTTERLTSGNLIMGLGNHEFLFYEPYERIWRYNILSRKIQPLWQSPGRDGGFRMRPGEPKHYDYAYLSLSPDERFLFVPWHVPTRTKGEFLVSPVLEYEVYDLASGEKRGAFVNIHRGKFVFRFLGWDETGQIPKGVERAPKEAQPGSRL
jgi:hypothetical protein